MKIDTSNALFSLKEGMSNQTFSIKLLSIKKMKYFVNFIEKMIKKKDLMIKKYSMNYSYLSFNILIIMILFLIF